MLKNDRLRLTVLSKEQIKRLHEATLEILENTGVIVDTPEAGDLLYQNGAKVKDNNVRIPEHLLNKALKTVPNHISLYDRKGETSLEISGSNVYFGGWVENLYIYDPGNGQLRSPVLDDLEYAAIIFADEIIGMVKHITGGIEISSGTLAVVTIHEIGLRGNFLSHQSTLENFRSFWYPDVFTREPAQTWISKKDKPDLRARLRRRADELVRDHKISPLGKDVEADLKDVELRLKKRS